jgi:copper chaperone CopZ
MEVSDLPGVKTVEASEDTKTVKITFDNPTTETEIKSLLAEINYPAVS